MNSVAKEEYRFVEKLGRGSYGTVSKHWVQSTQSFVAIKDVVYGRTLLAEQAPGRKEWRDLSPTEQVATTERESDVTKELFFLKRFSSRDHFGIAKLLDYFIWYNEKVNQRKDGGQQKWAYLWLSLVLPYYPFSLTSLTSGAGWRDEIHLDTLEEIYLHVCLGVEEMRLLNVVHGDLGPNNIVLEFTGDVRSNPRAVVAKIIDFGAASFAKPDVLQSVRRCTLNYRAPEALLGNLHYRNTCNSDLWSLGTVGADLFFSEGSFFPVLSDPKLYSIKEFPSTSEERDMEVVPRFVSILSVLGTPTEEELNSLNSELPHRYREILLGIRAFSKVEFLVSGRGRETQLLENLVIPILKWNPADREVGFSNILEKMGASSSSREKPKRVEEMVLEPDVSDLRSPGGSQSSKAPWFQEDEEPLVFSQETPPPYRAFKKTFGDSSALFGTPSEEQSPGSHFEILF